MRVASPDAFIAAIKHGVRHVIIENHIDLRHYAPPAGRTSLFRLPAIRAINTGARFGLKEARTLLSA